MVDSSGLENRYSSEQRTIEGSNPSLSFCLLNQFFSLFVWPGPFYEIKGDGSIGGIAEPEQKKTIE